MVQTLIAVLVGIVGVCLAVVGGVLFQVAFAEWRMTRRVGELAPSPSGKTGDPLRSLLAASIVLGIGLALVLIVVVLELT